MSVLQISCDAFKLSSSILAIMALDVKIENEIEELCLDGGKVRLRTPLGEACQWRDYQGICINQEVIAAFSQDNQTLTNWVNQKKLGTTVTCLGDGHDKQLLNSLIQNSCIGKAIENNGFSVSAYAPL